MRKSANGPFAARRFPASGADGAAQINRKRKPRSGDAASGLLRGQRACACGTGKRADSAGQAGAREQARAVNGHTTPPQTRGKGQKQPRGGRKRARAHAVTGKRERASESATPRRRGAKGKHMRRGSQMRATPRDKRTDSAGQAVSEQTGAPSASTDNTQKQPRAGAPSRRKSANVQKQPCGQARRQHVSRRARRLPQTRTDRRTAFFAPAEGREKCPFTSRARKKPILWGM